MPPASKEVQRAALQTARLASTLFKKVVTVPQAPAPAASGVQLADFQRALPVYRWMDLVTFANHFGKCRTVREDIAAELATEIRKRMTTSGLNLEALSAQNSRSRQAGQSDPRQDLAAREPREVAAVVYAFSKLVPQQPAYTPVFDGLAQGVQQGTWRFSRLQAALIGTALADVDLHLADALPAVVLPVVRELSESAEARAEVSIDELRYLVHACAKLPRPGLTAEEAEAVVTCTKRLAGSATFPQAAHLLLGWLQVRPRTAAKRAHQDALRAVCAQLGGQRPQNSAHPLPAGGLAPVLTDLLEREREREPPPLTPPMFRDIVNALRQISSCNQSEAAHRSKSLSVVDWTEIAWLVAAFCEAHGTASPPEPGTTAPQRLPGWAADTLGYVFSRAHQRTLQGVQSADLDTVLALLRLLRSYSPSPAPNRHFFTWASQRIFEHYEAGHADPTALAQAVAELVPHLVQEDRGQLLKVLQGLPPQARAPALAKPEAMHLPSHRLLVGYAAELKRPSASGVTLAGAPADKQTAAALTGSPAAKGLWGLLADGTGAGAYVAAPGLARMPQAAAGAEAEARVSAAPKSDAQETSDGAAAVVPQALEAGGGGRDFWEPQSAAQLPEIDAGGRGLQEVQASSSSPEAVGNFKDVQDLQVRLESALERVEALEARLEESEQRQAAATPRQAGSLHTSPVAQATPFGDWETPALPHGVGTTAGADVSAPGSDHDSDRVMPHAAYLHRPFNFEEFRRAHSRRLQSERLRVLVPADHIPMWPLHRK